MKRAAALFLSVLLLFGLASCGETKRLDQEAYLRQVSTLKEASDAFVAALEDWTQAILSADGDPETSAEALQSTAQPFSDFAAIPVSEVPKAYAESHAALAEACKNWADYVPDYAQALLGFFRGNVDTATFTETVARCSPLQDALTLALQGVEAVEVPS